MATSYCSAVNLFVYKSKPQIVNGGEKCSFLPSLDPPETRRLTAVRRTGGNNRGSKNTDLFLRNATPEAVAVDVISSSSISIPGIPFSIPTDNPWVAAIAAMFVAGPLCVQWILNVTKQVDLAAETVEKIADAVEKVAEEVDKAAEEIVEKLPDGRLKQVAQFVEHIAEEVDKDAEKVEELMDKVEDMSEKLETFIKQQSKEAADKS